jgi:hypothetical protein
VALLTLGLRDADFDLISGHMCPRTLLPCLGEWGFWGTLQLRSGLASREQSQALWVRDRVLLTPAGRQEVGRLATWEWGSK